MSLLELQAVGKRYRSGEFERAVLRDVTFELDAGQIGVVWGQRGCGRSTLLRLAAGVEPPDSGVVRFAGADMAAHGKRALGVGVGYLHRSPGNGESQAALDHVMVALLARGVRRSQARLQANEALERTGAAHCAPLRLTALETGEAVRVALARVLVSRPLLLVADEPTHGVDVPERDGILTLLHSLSADGIAVLASTSDVAGLSGADFAFTLSEGELRGAPQAELAPVLELRRPVRQAGG